MLNPSEHCTLKPTVKGVNRHWPQAKKLDSHAEPEQGFGDSTQIEVMVYVGYTQEETKRPRTARGTRSD